VSLFAGAVDNCAGPCAAPSPQSNLRARNTTAQYRVVANPRRRRGIHTPPSTERSNEDAIIRPILRVAFVASFVLALALPITISWGADSARQLQTFALADTLTLPLKKVPTVDVGELPDNAVLVDVREEKEQAISRLPGAIPLTEFKPDGRPVVFYCTVGYRSHLAAAEWKAKGVNAFNLRGGVLAWTHAGLLFEHEGADTKRVHVYSKDWDLSADGYEATW
jgi:rhodanese-related sulfurtransferase